MDKILPKRKTLAGRFTTFSNLMMGVKGHDEESVKYAARRAALGVCIGIVSSFLSLAKYEKD